MSKKIELLKVFVFTHELPGIKQVKFEDLRAGDIFYCEEPDGTLDVKEFLNGDISFIHIALDNPEDNPTISKVPCVRIASVMPWGV
jgi:hypothetical protein